MNVTWCDVLSVEHLYHLLVVATTFQESAICLHSRWLGPSTLPMFSHVLIGEHQLCQRLDSDTHPKEKGIISCVCWAMSPEPF